MRFTDIRRPRKNKTPPKDPYITQPLVALEKSLDENIREKLAVFKALVKALPKEEIKNILQRSIGSKNMPKLSAMIQFLELRSGEEVSEDFIKNIILLSLLYGSEKNAKELTFTDLVFQALYETLSKRLKNSVNAMSPGLAHTLDLYCIKFNNKDCTALLLDDPEAFKTLLIKVYGSLQTVEFIAKMYLSLLLENENLDAIDTLVKMFMTDPSNLRKKLREMLRLE